MQLNNSSAGAIANKWLNNLRDAAASYRAGVQAITSNPLEKAAQNEQGWAMGCQNAAANNRFSTGLRRVTFQDWKTAASGLGGDAIANLPQAKANKVIQFWNRWLPTLISVVGQVRAMDNSTYAARKQRAIAMMDGLHNAANQGGNAPAMNMP